MKKSCDSGRQDHPGVHPKDKQGKGRIDENAPEWSEKIFEQALANSFCINFLTTLEGKIPVSQRMKDDRSPDALGHDH
jgi:hypothetical protein